MDKSSSGVNKISEIAYDHAQKMIEDQKNTLSTLRQRATAVTSLAGIAATFLGRAAISDADNTTGYVLGSFSISEWVAIWSLVLTVGCTVWLLMPRKWYFLMQPTKIFDQFVIDRISLEETLLAV